MSNIVMLFACLAIGMGLRRFNRLPDQAPISINAFLINVSLPAVTFLRIHAVRLDQSLLYAALMPWLIFAMSAFLFWYFGARAAIIPSDHRCARGIRWPRKLYD
jgi:malate permease and related proteins